jgi:hypothetical protein
LLNQKNFGKETGLLKETGFLPKSYDMGGTGFEPVAFSL